MKGTFGKTSKKSQDIMKMIVGVENEMLSDEGRGEGVLTSALDVQSLFLLLKKIRYAPWSDI